MIELMGTCPRCGKKLSLFVDGKLWTSDVFHKEWKGQVMHQECAAIATEEAQRLSRRLTLNGLPSCENCHYYRYDTNNQTINTGTFTPNYKVLTFKSYNCAKFGFPLKAGDNKAEKCTSYITEADYEKKCLSGELNTGKANIQIIIDFSSLKEVMSKGGVVMTTYNCPNCNGMVDIPEAGKVLMCKYCGTAIKPVDIFDKIKSLML